MSVHSCRRRILDELLYRLSYGGALPLLAGTDELLAYLRSRNLFIVCSPTALTVDGKPSAETANPHHNHPSMGMTLVGVNVSEDRHRPMAN
jgi:hypothetical protein